MKNKNNLIIIFVSTFLSIFFCYILFFTYIYFQKHTEHPFLFSSLETLEFNKKYYNKVHHLRNVGGRENKIIKGVPQNYLYSTIRQFSNKSKNVLLQGDSWILQMDKLVYKKSHDLLKEFADKNNFGLINAGISSYSPSLMLVQYKILEKDFNIKPDIVVAYFDQRDLGDEVCSYKDKRVFDKNNNLVAIQKESHSRASFDLTKIFKISETILLHESKIIRTFKLTNFFIEYGVLRFVKKSKAIYKHGWKNRDDAKCRFKSKEYLNNVSDEDISYFENRIKDYINLLKNKTYINKIILVTFPHDCHLFEDCIVHNEKTHYSINISDIVEKVIKNEKKVYHLNFSRLISKGTIKLEKDAYVKGDPASHLDEKMHKEIFTKNIINILKN